MSRSLLPVALLAALVLPTALGAKAQAQIPQPPCCPPHTNVPTPPWEVIQHFPAAGPTQTAWKVHYAQARGKGLYITGAWFKKSATASWIRVLWDARVSDIFVPYHPGSPRFYDLSGFNFPMVRATPADAGCCGTILDGVVIKEVRDRGVLWKDDRTVRRGEELVLWATIDAANYNYIFQYGFRDDGTITFRLGATARNLPGSEYVSHMHTTLWRVDIDLDGHRNDSAFLTRHLETTMSRTASDVATRFDVEGAVAWDDLEYRGIRVQDGVTRNGKGRAISYDLMPLRRGTPRHSEPFSHLDFWVSRYRFGELTYTQVPTYIANQEWIADSDVVLWYMSGAHHLPRDEDGEKVNGRWRGSALVMWSGFDLRPRDLFDRTPLFP